jgi:cation diffusion facilitator family transporter
MKNEKKRIALVSVGAALFLTSFKLIVGIITGSLGILSEALHSGLDLVAAVITFFAVRISDKPPDRDHHFGHGKVENLSAFVETILLFATCIWIIYEAVSRLMSGRTHIEVNFWSYLVVVSSIIVDFSRSRALMRVAKKHNSQALEADALHFSTDIWSSGVVLLGLICANFGLYTADSMAALAVASIILVVTFRLGKRSVNMLLDRVPDDVYEKLNGILGQIKGVEYFHDLRVRVAGADIFVEVNIHVRPQLDVHQSHEIATKVEERIRAEVPRCSVHVHIEPDE